MTEFLREYGWDMLRLLGDHMLLTFLALLISCAIALPLGVILARSRHRRLAAVVLGIANVFQPIPSLALVALVGVVFIYLDLPTIGMLPGLVALIAYAVLPVLRNTYTGLRQVDPTIIEVATGMGMRPRQVLFQVELPLALPVIMAGIRIATVWTIGVATLVSLIGAHSLGDLIFRGLSRSRIGLVLGGALPAVGLALLFDWVLGKAEKSLMPKGMDQSGKASGNREESIVAASSKRVLVVVLVAALLIAAGALVAWRLADRPDVYVGGKDFTEQLLLGEIMAILVEEHTSLSVGQRPYLGGTMVCFNGLRRGDLDVYAEYTGTGLVNILDEPAVGDPNEAYRTVRDQFAAKYDLVWLKPLGFNNTYTLALRRKQAEPLGLRTFSDLAGHLRSGKAPQLTAGFTAEFLDRPDGYKGLAKAHDLSFPAEPRQLDPGLMYKACAEGSVDVICAFATDGRIAAFDLVTLEDDKGFFPPYQAAPLVRGETLRKHPQLEAILNRLAGRIDDETMRSLNYQVDRKDNPRRARDVAREFLRKARLID